MGIDDLDRVRADLATMKNVCHEPAIPREELAVCVIVAIFGAVLAAASWVVPLFWVRLGVAVFGIAGAALYTTWKLRIVKRDAPRRRLEVKELVAWSIIAVGLNAYVPLRKVLVAADGGYTPDMARRDWGAVLFFLGVAFLTSATIHRTRRPNIAVGLTFIVVGIVYPFTTSAAEVSTLGGVTMALACLGYGVWLAKLARAERREHAGN